MPVSPVMPAEAGISCARAPARKTSPSPSILTRHSKPSRTLRICDAPRRLLRSPAAILDRFSLPRGEEDGRGGETALIQPNRETD